MTDPRVPVPQRRGWSVRSLLLVMGVGALLYVALIGVGVAYRIGPAAANLHVQSADVLAEFNESRARVDVLDSALTDLWRYLGIGRTRPVAIDTLEHLRLRLQRLATRESRSSTLTASSTAPAELRRALANAGRREEHMYSAMIGAIAALELHEIPATERLLRHADSVDTPLNDALGEATSIALRDVNRHEAELATVARRTSLLVWVWLLAGLITIPLLALTLRARLYRPLAAMDRGLARVAAGDLGASFTIERNDELGRLGEHFNHMTAVLRQRALEEDQRLADRTAARTRLILDAALDAVAVVDTDGLVREWNPKAESVFGWRRDEVLGRPIAERVFPRQIVETYKGDILAGTSQVLNKYVETVAFRRDGSRFPVEITITPLTGGAVLEFSVFVRDISDRHEAQAALASSEARYRAAFEQAAVGMTETGADGRYLRVNRAFAGILDYPVQELVGQPFNDFTHVDDRLGDLKAFASLIQGDVPFVQREKRYVRADGTPVWVQLTSALVRDSAGTPAYALSIIQDLSERKRLENDLVQVQKMDAVGRLAGGIAHDFNNLLSGIMGYADLLHHADDASDRVRADAQAIIATAQRGADLAQNLLALARRTPSRAERVDLNAVVAEVRELVARTFDRRIELRLDLDAEATVVIGDRSHLSNAMLNLAVNARDAMPQGGRLTFSTRRLKLDAAFCARHADAPAPGEYVAVSVRDTGMGITSETRARIFEPFFTTKEVGKGTGLGLAMVYGAVRSHNGIIEVESELGAGALFTLYFPRADAADGAAPAELPSLVLGHGRILLADDEAVVREVATRMIERLGYTVDSVADGEMAVDRVSAEPALYDMIILDGDMPRMTGRDAARRIRDLRPDVPLLLATGYLSPDDAEPLESYGFNAAIAKPYALTALSRLIGEHLAP